MAISIGRMSLRMAGPGQPCFLSLHFLKLRLLLDLHSGTSWQHLFALPSHHGSTFLPSACYLICIRGLHGSTFFASARFMAALFAHTSYTAEPFLGVWHFMGASPTGVQYNMAAIPTWVWQYMAAMPTWMQYMVVIPTWVRCYIAVGR